MTFEQSWKEGTFRRRTKTRPKHSMWVIWKTIIMKRHTPTTPLFNSMFPFPSSSSPPWPTILPFKHSQGIVARHWTNMLQPRDYCIEYGGIVDFIVAGLPPRARGYNTFYTNMKEQWEEEEQDYRQRERKQQKEIKGEGEAGQGKGKGKGRTWWEEGKNKGHGKKGRRNILNKKVRKAYLVGVAVYYSIIFEFFERLMPNTNSFWLLSSKSNVLMLSRGGQKFMESLILWNVFRVWTRLLEYRPAILSQTLQQMLLPPRSRKYCVPDESRKYCQVVLLEQVLRSRK